MRTATLFSDRAMRATTFALTFALAVLATGIVSAFFATALTANALAGLPRVNAAPYVQMAANGAPNQDSNNSAVVR
jgi:hypothetical protein